jgi:hypothetical protein
VPLPLHLYPKGRGYKEDNRVGYNMISIRTLSLLTYFTYISIYIPIYAKGEHVMVLWNLLDDGSSHIRPLLAHLSPCGVIPCPQVLYK